MQHTHEASRCTGNSFRPVLDDYRSHSLPVDKRKPIDGDLPQRLDGDGPEWSVHLVESQWLPSVFSTSISTAPGAASRTNFIPSSHAPNPSLNGVAGGCLCPLDGACFEEDIAL